MPAILQKKPPSFGAGYKSGPPPNNIQMPSLPKQMEGKYVKGQMYKYQESLPKLPVPPLQQTLGKYLKGVQVIPNVASVVFLWRMQSCVDYTVVAAFV